MENTVNSLCKNAKKCSGCQMNNLTYSEQLKLKQKKINSLFSKLILPEKIVPSPDFLRYRNKASAIFFESKSKDIVWGIYQSATEGFCSSEECIIQPKIADDIFNTLACVLKSFKIKLYNPKTQSGFFRSAMVRYSQSTKQVMLVLVTGEGAFPKERSFINAILKKHSEITTIVQSIYKGSAVIMTGEEEKVLYGKGYIEDIILSNKFIVSAHSFYQINSKQTENLYATAIKLAQLNENSEFLDAYCGTGTIGIIAAAQAKNGLGVEINSTAVLNAQSNAQINSRSNISFVCGDAGDYLKEKNKHFDVVFTDPPRAGCSMKFLNSLIKAAPEKIIYISCNPETQVRDAKYLIKNGYAIKKCVPFDLFPQTHHIESVVQLAKKSLV